MFNSKPSTSNEGTSKLEEKIKVCKSCRKFFNESRILKHITHSSCENDYTKEEIDMLTLFYTGFFYTLRYEGGSF